MALPTIRKPTVAPNRAMARDVYPVVADQWAASIGPFTEDLIVAISWMGQQVTDVADYKDQAAASAKAAAKSVEDAAAQVKLATDQAIDAKRSADTAKGWRDSAQVSAQAAQAAAGLPSTNNPGAVMRQKLDGSGGVEWWNLVVTQIGDTIVSTQAPDAGWVPTGGIYSQSLFPALFAKLGRIPDFRDDQMTAVATPGPSVFSMYAAAAGNNAVLLHGLNQSSNTYQFLYSLNAGATWSAIGSTASAYGYPMAYGNGVIVTGYNGVAGSTIFDTTTGAFTSGNLNQATWFDGAFGNNIFAFITNGNSSNNLARSLDNGKTWSYSQLPTDLNNPAVIRFLNGLFMVFGNATGISVYYTSPDGVTWTKRNLPGVGISVQRNKVAVNNNAICIFDATGFYVSKDGISWQSAPLVSGMIANSGFSISGGDNVFAILTGGTYGKVYFSVDGLKWASRDKILTLTQQNIGQHPLPYVNGYFIATVSQQTIIWRIKAYSYNGSTQFYATDALSAQATQIGLTQYIRGA